MAHMDDPDELTKVRSYHITYGGMVKSTVGICYRARADGLLYSLLGSSVY